MNAVPQHRGLASMCCCRWNHNVGVRLDTHPECAVHGLQAQLDAPRKALEMRRLTAQMAVSSARLEALTWIRRHRAARRKLAAINQKLKELGA
jgi:hypothetical protein